MKEFIATVKEIQNVDNLHIVKFDFNGVALSMMSLDLSADVAVGRRVLLGVKPTHIAIAKEFSGVISYSNQLRAKVTEIERGELLVTLSATIFDTSFESIITMNSLNKMDIEVSDEITLFIKASELSILEVLDD